MVQRQPRRALKTNFGFSVMELRGARVVITGASRGIGEALAVAFAGAGADVALVARDADAIANLAGALGGSAHVADLSDSVQVAHLIGRVEAEAGPVDVLVNNAAVTAAGYFATSSADSLREITEVNYLAPAELTRQVIPGMLKRGRGHIVNISSLAGSLVFPGLVAYSAAKAALDHFTAGLRADLRGLPLGITLVELGIVATDQARDSGGYPPTRAAAGRFLRTRLLDVVSREAVAQEVVSAVRRNRRHVRLPKRGTVIAMFAEAPRRASEFLLTGIDHRPGPFPADVPSTQIEKRPRPK